MASGGEYPPADEDILIEQHRSSGHGVAINQRPGPDADVSPSRRPTVELRIGADDDGVRGREIAVDVDELAFRAQCSKPREEYGQRTLTVNALERYEKHGIPRTLGQDVYYVVKDDARKDLGRVRLPFEDCSDYDVDHYVDVAIGAAESVLAPLGWEKRDIREQLRETRDATLGAWQ